MTKIKFQWKRPIAERSSFLKKRSPVSNEDFVMRLGCGTGDAWLVTAMREAIASRCRIPVEMLHLEDRLAELESLMGSGTFLRYIFDPCWCRWEHGLFLGRLEKRLGSLKNNIRHFTIGEAERELPPWKSSEGETVGDWLSQAVTVIKLP